MKLEGAYVYCVCVCMQQVCSCMIERCGNEQGPDQYQFVLDVTDHHYVSRFTISSVQTGHDGRRDKVKEEQRLAGGVRMDGKAKHGKEKKFKETKEGRR